jgi:hypothetical protein
MKKIFLTLPFVVALSGCGNDIDMIKNGTIDGYESTTIGKAFDNYSYKLVNRWEKFETKNGQKVVSVKMELRFPPFCGEDEYCNNTDGLRQFLNFGFGAYAYQEWRENVKNDGKSEECKIPEAYSSNIDFQFTINRDDTFEINYVGCTYSAPLAIGRFGIAIPTRRLWITEAR